MQLGEKIQALRKENNMTQSQLGKLLNVSYQAVSKWERGETLPDFTTIEKMVEIFNVPLDYFGNYTVDGNQNREEREEQKTIVVEKVDMPIGSCVECGKMIFSEDDVGETSPKMICRDCVKRIATEQYEIEMQDLAEQIHKEKARKYVINKQCRRGFIIGGLLAIVALVVGIIVSVKNGYGGVGIGVTIPLAVMLFTYGSQVTWWGIVTDITFLGGKVIGSPAVIFSFDLDGVAFLIAFKIAFAIIKLFVFLVTTAAIICVAMVVSIFSFIPALSRIRSGEEVDDIALINAMSKVSD